MTVSGLPQLRDSAQKAINIAAVRVDSQLLQFTLGCLAAVLLGAAALRMTRGRQGLAAGARAIGALSVMAGLGGLGLISLAEFTGRLGPEHFWFREPTFYIAVAALAGAALWWLRRPGSPWMRFGLPAAVVFLAFAALFLGRIDGRAMPLAMSMPTLAAQAPELSYFDEAGRRQTLSGLRGKVVLLNFWATWCAPCRREMPLLSKMQREHAEAGLVVLYVSLEEPAVLEPFLAANKFDGVQGRLDHAADFYGAGKFYPLSFLITREGRVAYRWSGRPKEEWLSARVAELMQ